MKTLKKLFSVSAIVALLGTLAPMYAFGATYTDELEDAYAYARANGVTTKNTIDEADMYGSLTRVAMAKMIANYATSVLGLKADTSRKCTFSDVTAALDADYDNGVTNACQLGLMGIDDNGNVKATFDPKGIVTRAQFATALSRAISQAEDGEAIANGNPYYRTHIAYLNGKGIVKSEAEYDVNSVEKRGYVMLMMMRADKNYKPGCTTEQIVACALEDDTAACLAACSGNEGEDEGEEEGNGFVTVKRVGGSSTQDVAWNAVNKKIGSLKFTAGDEGVKVSSIVVKNSGLSDAEDISLKLSVNGSSASKIVDLKTSTDGTTIKFKPALEIKAGKSETVDVYAYLTSSPNATHTITVSDVVVNGKAEGLPIELGTLKTTSYTVYAVTGVSVTPTTTIVTAGKTNELLATVSFDVPVDATVNGFTIKNLGKTDLDEAIANVKAYYNNDVVGNVTVTDDEIIVTNLNIKTEADTISIKLKGDAILMDDTCNIELYVDLFGVDAVESSTKESMATIGTWTDDNTDDTLDNKNEKPLNIAGVDLKITKTSNGKQTVAPGTSNVVLYEATIESNSEFEVAKYTLTTTAADFNNFRGGKVVLSIDGVSTDLTYAELGTGDDEFTVDANKPVKVKVTANIKDTVTTASYTFTFGIVEINNANGDKISSFTTKSRQGDITEVENGDLTLSAASEAANANRRLYSNGTDIEVARFNMEAGSQDVTISTIELTNVFSGTATEFKLGNDDLTAAISSVRLVNAETNDEISDSCQVEASKVTCDMGDYVIGANEDFDTKVLVNLGNADYNIAPFKSGTELRRNLTVKVDVTEGRVGNQSRSTKTYTGTNNYVLGSRPANVTLEKLSSNKFKVTIENKDDNAISLSGFDFRFKPLSGDNYVATDLYCIRDLGSTVDNCTAATEKYPLNTGLATFTFADLTTLPASLEKGKKTSFEVYVDSTFANPSLQGAFLRLETSTQEDNYSIYAQ